MFSMILGPFGNVFNGVMTTLNDIGVKSGLQEFGLKVEFDEESLKVLPDEMADLYKQARPDIKEKNLGKIDMAIERMLLVLRYEWYVSFRCVFA